MNQILKDMDSKMNSNIISKYNPPTKFEQLPFGTLWLVEGDEPQYYIQISRDVEKPQWEKMGKFFEIIFKDYITNEIFLEECLKLFTQNEKV